MILRRRKKAADQRRHERLESELAKSRRELQAVKRRAQEQAPLLGKLQRHLVDNNFAERLVQSIDASRRRRTT
jgi:hypothetical protein